VGQDPSTGSAEMTGAQDPEQIQSEIERTREQLGETIEALAHKADVKAQARQRIEETKASVSDKKDDLLAKAREVSPESATQAASEVSQKARENPLPVAVAGAFAAGFLLGRISRR
jgi:ElaB/YqjD/DUF883 family membrane-anchored ribosome-binding protein